MIFSKKCNFFLKLCFFLGFVGGGVFNEIQAIEVPVFEKEAAKVWALEGSFKGTWTDLNWDSAGMAQSFSNGERFEHYAAGVGFRYGLSPSWTFFAKGNWLASRWIGISQEWVQFNLGEGTVGASSEMSFFHPRLSFAFQASASFPFYHLSQTQPSLGIGVEKARVGGFLSWYWIFSQTRPVRWLGGAFFEIRGKGNPTLFPWVVQIEQLPSMEGGFFWKGGLFGVLPLQNTGGLFVSQEESFLFRSKTPTFVAALGSVGWGFTARTSLALEGQYSFWGRSAAPFWKAMLTFTLRGGRQTGPKVPIHSKESLEKFLAYVLTATVLLVRDRLHLVKINRGKTHGVIAGDEFDLFRPTEDQEDPVARAKVLSVKLNEAVLRIEEYFQQQWIEKGFVARKLAE